MLTREDEDRIRAIVRDELRAGNLAMSAFLGDICRAMAAQLERVADAAGSKRPEPVTAESFKKGDR